MKLFILLLFLLVSLSGFSQGPTQRLLPNLNVLTTTFNIFTDTLSGTCFTIKDQNQEYVVTAKHLFRKSTKSNDSISIRINVNKLEVPYRAKVFFHPNPLIDIAILRLSKAISRTEPLATGGGDKYYMGQECLFLGYPLFSLGSLTQTDKIPFIKKAIISALYEENGIDIILLDGHNNPGFSGGPIITYSDKMDNQFIFGIVSGYINQVQNVKININKIDSLKNYVTINENSGIIIAYPAKYFFEVIKSIR